MPGLAAPPRRLVVDGAGRRVLLGAELGRGGEGNVYEVAGAPELVAKLYHAAVDAERAAKLAAMARGASAGLTDVAAWPTALLHPADSAVGPAGGRAGEAGAPVIGVVMPRASGAPVHRLYSPVSRRLEFPHVDWQRLVVVAHNLAAAVAQVHAAGHVIGDVNQGNALVAPDGRVRLIDCDSFQVRDPGMRDAPAPGGARWFLCEVGVAHFTPPELQGASFAGVIRTPNHDAFGLAVLVFHLLFMGRHPFAGRYGGPGDLPIERAIAEFRFAFGRNAAARQMAPPPHALPLASASPGVAELFERAFGRDGVRDGARPAAVEWKTALGALATATATCEAAPTHTYPRDLGACPWCAIARGGGPDFFAGTGTTVRSPAAFDVGAAWAAVLAVPAPAEGRALPTAPPVVHAPTQPLPQWRRVVWWSQGPVGVVAGGVILASMFSPSTTTGAVAAGLSALLVGLRRGSGLVDERKRREEALKAARERLAGTEARWTRDLGASTKRFHRALRELEVLRSEHQALGNATLHGLQGVDPAEREARLARRRDEIERALAAGPEALGQLGAAAHRLREQLTWELGTQRAAVGAAAADLEAAGGEIPAQFRTLAWLMAFLLMLQVEDVVSRIAGPARGDDAAELRARAAPVAVPFRSLPVPAPSTVRPPDGTFFDFQVEKQASLVPGTLALTYPAHLQMANQEGRAVVQFVVDTTGVAMPSTFRVLGASDVAFAAATEAAVAGARFYPAEVAGRRVRQLVQLPVSFTLSR